MRSPQPARRTRPSHAGVQLKRGCPCGWPPAQDPTIQAAVAEMKARRARVDELKQRLADMLREAEAAFDDE